MKIGYARVSGATGQETGLETQIEKLKAAGCERIYSESLSGKNTCEQRAEIVRFPTV